jgi:hypothetical protein
MSITKGMAQRVPPIADFCNNLSVQSTFEANTVTTADFLFVCMCKVEAPIENA